MGFGCISPALMRYVPDNRYQRFDNRLTPTPAHVHSCAGVLFTLFAGRHRALCEQQSSVPNGIRNRRRTGRNKRPFIIIYLFSVIFFPYATPKAAAKSAADTEVPAAASTNHYTLSGRKPVRNASTIHTRRGLSFLSARHEIHANRPSERPPPGRRAPDRVRNGRHSRRASAPPRRNVPTTPPGHKEQPCHRPPHRAGGRGMRKTAEQRSPPPNRTDT